MSGDIQALYNKVYELEGKRKQVQERVDSLKISLAKAQSRFLILEKAQTIIQVVAKQTQQELQYQLSELATLALKSVFDDPYEMKVDFIVRRGQTETDLSFITKDGEQVHPLTASGGGVADVAGFALRLSLKTMESTKTRQCLILDEPFRFLGKSLQNRAAEMLRSVSRKLGMQIIMISHEPEIIGAADRVFEISKKDGVSRVKASYPRPMATGIPVTRKSRRTT